MVLTNSYGEHVKHTSITKFQEKHADDDKEGEDIENLGLTNFDFHSASRANGGLDGVRDEIKYLGPVGIKKKEFSYTIMFEGKKVRGQRGVFRTNCLDW